MRSSILHFSPLKIILFLKLQIPQTTSAQMIISFLLYILDFLMQFLHKVNFFQMQGSKAEIDPIQETMFFHTRTEIWQKKRRWFELSQFYIWDD